MSGIERREIEVRRLASGAALQVSVYTARGTTTGAPSAYIQSSMHGDEVQGNAVIAELIAHFAQHPPVGDVVLVPNANPFGLNQKGGEFTLGRFDPTTGENWNRNYWLAASRDNLKDLVQIHCSTFVEENIHLPWPELARTFKQRLEAALRAKLAENIAFGRKLSLQLQSLALAADNILDLHCANVSVRHLYAPEHAADPARYFQIPFQLHIPNEFAGALDEAAACPWWTLWDCLREANYAHMPALSQLPLGFTLELGDHERVSQVEAREDAAGIMNYLRYRGVVDGKPEPPRPGYSCKLANYRKVFCATPGQVDYTAPMGKVCKKGDELARSLQFHEAPQWQSVIADTDCIPILRHSSAVIHEGSELMSLFTDFREI